MKLPDEASSTRHASRVAENPERLAQRASLLLRQRILSDFGVDVSQGAELEVGVLPNDPKLAKEQIGSFYKVPAGKRENDSYPPSVNRSSEERDPYFAESGRVSYCYEEDSRDSSWGIIEAVMSHCPADESGNPLANDPVTFARSIAGLRREMREGPNGRTPSIHDKVAAEFQSPQWNSFVQQNVSALSTKPGQSSENRNTHGMHLNIGLVEPSTQADVLSKLTDKERTVTTQGMCQGLNAIFLENLYLITSGESSIARWSKAVSSLGSMNLYIFPKTKTLATGETSYYIQNKLPDMSANPYYAEMLQMAGIWLGLNGKGFAYNPAGNCVTLKSPERDTETKFNFNEPRFSWSNLSSDKLRKIHEHCHQLKDVLNTCEPHLGDRFYSAIMQSPPAHEPLPDIIIKR